MPKSKRKYLPLTHEPIARKARLSCSVADLYVKDLEGGLARYLGYAPTRSMRRIMAAALAPEECLRGWMVEGVEGWWAKIDPMEWELGEEAAARLPADQITLLCDIYVHGRGRQFVIERIRRSSKRSVVLTDENVQDRLRSARRALFRSVARAIG